MGSYYCTPSFFRTRSRKLTIYTSRSLASNSNSLRSFLETKNFYNNETSFCCSLNVFLFPWCCTNSFNQRPTDTTCYCFPSFFLKKKKKKKLEAPLKSRQIWKAIWMNVGWTTLIGSKAFTLSMIIYSSTCENSCTPSWLAVQAFLTCENKAYRFLQISFTKQNSRDTCNKLS